jgi:hypothetical protein
MNLLRLIPAVHLTETARSSLLIAAVSVVAIFGVVWLVLPFVVASRLKQANRESARQSEILRQLERTCAKIGQLANSLDDIRAMLTQNPQLVVDHAKRQYATVPFPQGEAIIAADGAAALDYAETVLDRPFPAGEPAIAKDGKLSCRYALNVLGGRFPLGEPAINRDPEAKRTYEEGVLKIDGRLIETCR